MDSTEYEPGTVAVVTACGVEGVRAMWRDAGNGWLAGWFLESGHAYAPPVEITDVRPLVVLDWTPNQTDLPILLTLLRDNHWTSLADQIEAQTKPPRIPEPGLWGVVEASVGKDGRYRFVRAGGFWMCTADSSTYLWASLIDPVLIREGVES